MASCPNKNLREYRDLVAMRGSPMAHFLWAKYAGNVPNSEYIPVNENLEKLVTRLSLESDLYVKEEVDNSLIKGVKKELLHPSGKTERYKNKETGEIIYHRVTDKQTELFVQKKGYDEAVRIDSLPDNVIKREKGTEIHAVNSAIMNLIISKTTSKYVSKEGVKNKVILDKTEIKKLANLNDAQYQVLYDNVNKLIDQLVEQQKSIDDSGKVTILSETTIIDKDKSLGGSVDVLGIFSDLTASIYDYKSITPSAEYLDNRRNLIKNPIPNYKRESYNIQIAQYKEVLKDKYGVREIRQSRVIPIKLDFKLKPKEERKSSSYLTRNISNIQMGDFMSPFLSQVSLAYEKTGDDELDKLINFQERTAHNLEKKLEKLFGEEKQKVQDRIERLNDSVNNLRLRKDYRSTINDARRLVIEYVGRDMLSGRLAVEDKTDDLYMNTQDILVAIEDLSIYKALGVNFSNILKEFADIDKKVYKVEKEEINTLTGAINDTIGVLEEKLIQRLQELAVSKNENLEDIQNIDISIFDRLSEVNHPVFKTFSKLLQERQNFIRHKINELDKKLHELTQNLSSYDKIINPKTGNMYSRLSEEFWEKREEAYAERDIKWFKDNYVVNQKYVDNYVDRLEKYRKKLELQYDDIFLINRKLDSWVEINNPSKLGYWFGGAAKWQTKLKDEVYEEYKSKEFKDIEADKSLLDFYHFVEEKNGEFRKLLNMTYLEMPDNFLPNIRRDLVEKLVNGEFKMGDNFQSFIDTLKIDEDKDGKRIGVSKNPITGEIEKEIPKFYLKPFFKDGKINPNEKSKELAASLLLFGQMAYNYQAMSAIESDIEGMSYLLGKGNIETLDTNKRGNKFKDFTGDWAKKLGIDTNAVDKFRAWQNYYIYGIKIDNSMISDDSLLGSDVSKTKVVLAAKNYLSAKLLGFAFIPAAGAHIASRVNMYYEAVKGQYFTTNNSDTAHKTVVTDFKKHFALSKFMEIGQEEMSLLKAKDLKLSKVSKYVNMETLMAPYRKGDDLIDDHIVNSMSHNWGVTEDGKIMRMDKLKKHFERLNKDLEERGLKKRYEAKSIWELTTHDEKKDELKIEGLNEEGYVMFRNACRKAKASITGLMSSEDINNANINLYMNLIMQFKNWMPGLYKERFGGVKYDKELDIVEQGKYSVLAGELFKGKKEDESYGRVAMMMASSALRMAGDIATFGLSNKLFGRSIYKINEERARVEYNKFLEMNPSFDPSKNNNKGLTFEDFIEMKQRQLMSGLAEFRAILMIMALALALGGDWDDDGEKDYKKYWATRQLYKVINRAQLELGFSTNPNDFIKLVQTPLPLSRLLLDIYYTFSNTLDESRDLVIGENSHNDKTPIGYYSSQWVPGIKAMENIFELYHQ